jgi:hypothetical protein
MPLHPFEDRRRQTVQVVLERDTENETEQLGLRPAYPVADVEGIGRELVSHPIGAKSIRDELSLDWRPSHRQIVPIEQDALGPAGVAVQSSPASPRMSANSAVILERRIERRRTSASSRT